MTTPMPEPRWGKTYGLTPDIWAWGNSSDGASLTLEVWPGHEAQAKEMLQAMCDMYGRAADIRAAAARIDRAQVERFRGALTLLAEAEVRERRAREATTPADVTRAADDDADHVPSDWTGARERLAAANKHRIEEES